uniref:helicase-related protein n=1 Tax=Treponema sp. TaxID=166 RepID=UPI00298D84E8
GDLRIIFAKISLEKLEPDLVIMDEFQRFKYLLNSDPESDIGMLASKFFNSDSVRMLLLSATPYKMYSTLEEIDEEQIDEHYSEFLNVMKFLKPAEEDNQKFKEIWNNYSVKLKELDFGSDVLLSAKKAAEDSMYENVCRTERISSKDNADIIDTKDIETPIEVLEKDIKSYVQAQRLLDEIGASYSIPVDYIKSCPYLLSFMRDYQLKRDVERYFKKHSDCLSIVNKDTLWLKKSSIDKYEKVPSNNARLEHIMNKVFSKNAELLLWIPPSKPYYAPQGKFKDIKNFSKTLIFSSWEMVPRMLASLISYEAERKTVGTLAMERKDDAHYFYNEMADENSKTSKKRYPSSRLNFSVKEGKANSMALFTLMYPSKTLTEAYNPIDCLNMNLSLQDIEKEIKRKIKEKLSRLPNKDSGRVDKRWYFFAPLLMDDAEYVQDWLFSDEYLSVYDDDSRSAKKQKGFLTHLYELQDLYESTEGGTLCPLGKRPPDLINVLVDMALASPAVCLNRTYLKYSKTSTFESYLPSQVAKLFINRMNTAESTAAVELACGRKADDDAHWMNVLTYSKHGNIQAMFDEYAHVVVNGLDKDEHLIEKLHKTIADSLSIKTTPYAFDTSERFKKRILGDKDKAVNIRTHYAVAFTKGDGKDSDTDRKKTVRNAFNSPFRPFALASTSIGQEGLDFHNYCRRIVHWNLPSNPIDLEQREGRINRFECLAIRQNVAARYGNIKFKNDVWTEMFEQAKKIEKTEGCSDMIPFWGLKEKPDMIKIERIVPMYPYSKDGEAYARLIKILSLYRLTLGQARQEELLEYIFQNKQNLNDIEKYFINLSPFYREKKTCIEKKL